MARCMIPQKVTLSAAVMQREAPISTPCFSTAVTDSVPDSAPQKPVQGSPPEFGCGDRGLQQLQVCIASEACSERPSTSI